MKDDPKRYPALEGRIDRWNGFVTVEVQYLGQDNRMFLYHRTHRDSLTVWMEIIFICFQSTSTVDSVCGPRFPGYCVIVRCLFVVLFMRVWDQNAYWLTWQSTERTLNVAVDVWVNASEQLLELEKGSMSGPTCQSLSRFCVSFDRHIFWDSGMYLVLPPDGRDCR